MLVLFCLTPKEPVSGAGPKPSHLHRKRTRVETEMTPENNVIIIVLPGVIAMLLLGVFSFLYRQSRQAYFRAWQIGWAAYTASYVILAIYFFKFQTLAPLLAAKLLFAVTIFA